MRVVLPTGPINGQLKVQCWCQRHVLWVDAELVRECRTVSCGDKDCHD